MLKQSLLYLSEAGWARSMTTHFPPARQVAHRFVAGEAVQAAIETTRELNAQGMTVTLDYLGESVTHESDTDEVVTVYQNVLDAIQTHQLDSGISLKLTHLGLDISEELAVTNLRHILTRAQQNGNIPVTIDMESSKYTDITLQIYRTMRDEYDFGHIVGTVLQSYLRRTDDDMHTLAQHNQSHIRLCKGAYMEPPDIAFPDKADVDANYIRCMETYLTADSDAYLCIATHDEKMIQAAQDIIQQHNIPSDRYEFQMLYGIRSERQKELAQQHTMRVYVPFGEAWYPYFMRRLAERPANLWFFLSNLFR